MGLAIVSWKRTSSSVVRKEEMITTAKQRICFLSHLMHDVLGNMQHYFVNMRN